MEPACKPGTLSSVALALTGPHSGLVARSCAPPSPHTTPPQSPARRRDPATTWSAGRTPNEAVFAPRRAPGPGAAVADRQPPRRRGPRGRRRGPHARGGGDRSARGGRSCDGGGLKHSSAHDRQQQGGVLGGAAHGPLHQEGRSHASPHLRHRPGRQRLAQRLQHVAQPCVGPPEPALCRAHGAASAAAAAGCNRAAGACVRRIRQQLQRQRRRRRPACHGGAAAWRRRAGSRVPARLPPRREAAESGAAGAHPGRPAGQGAGPPAPAQPHGSQPRHPPCRPQRRRPRLSQPLCRPLRAAPPRL